MKNKTLKKIRNLFFVMIIRVTQFVFFFIPWRAGRAVGSFLGTVLYRVLPRERKKALNTVETAYAGSLNTGGKRKIVKEAFKNIGIGFFEFVKFTVWSAEKTVSLVKETEGLEHFVKAGEEKTGIIAVTAHFSNWELIPFFIKAKGFNAGIIGTRLFDPRLDRIVNATRAKAGVKVFDRDAGIKGMIKALKQGIILGILADQDTRVDSEIIPFLGTGAKTPVGPAVLAKKLSLKICTLFIIRRKDGYYKLVINKPYENVKDMKPEEIARLYNDEISSMIRKYPGQWAWIHERWKSVNIADS